MREPSFWDKWEWARAHQKPEPKLALNPAGAVRAPMTVTPSGPAASLVIPINSPAARPPSDADFGFDAAGPGLLGVAWRHPVDAAVAGVQAVLARREAGRRYPGHSGGGQNQEGDAFRHAYWNAIMTRLLGPERAGEYANAVEIQGSNKAGERQMDLYNNREGRALATQPGPLADTIKKAITDGRLRTRPF
jgi:hypothetical protein